MREVNHNCFYFYEKLMRLLHSCWCFMMVILDCSLTVEDSDHEKNSTVANITVLQMPDYPPVANAGQDVIIYLPHHNVTLNGNLSSDDKAIVSWEWTKSPSDQDKAVDMQVLVMFTSTFYCRSSLFSMKVNDNELAF